MEASAVTKEEARGIVKDIIGEEVAALVKAEVSKLAAKPDAQDQGHGSITPADRTLSRGMSASFSTDGEGGIWKVMHSMDLRKSKAQKQYESRVMGDAKPGYIDVDVGYSQERASIFSLIPSCCSMYER